MSQSLGNIRQDKIAKKLRDLFENDRVKILTKGDAKFTLSDSDRVKLNTKKKYIMIDILIKISGDKEDGSDAKFIVIDSKRTDKINGTEYAAQLSLYRKKLNAVDAIIIAMSQTKASPFALNVLKDNKIKLFRTVKTLVSYLQKTHRLKITAERAEPAAPELSDDDNDDNDVKHDELDDYGFEVVVCDGRAPQSQSPIPSLLPSQSIDEVQRLKNELTWTRKRVAKIESVLKQVLTALQELL